MKQPNDDRYRKMLQSTLPDYDKGEAWEAIAAQLPQKKRRLAWLWLLGAAVVFMTFLLAIMMAQNVGVQAFPIPVYPLAEQSAPSLQHSSLDAPADQKTETTPFPELSSSTSKNKFSDTQTPATVESPTESISAQSPTASTPDRGNEKLLWPATNRTSSLLPFIATRPPALIDYANIPLMMLRADSPPTPPPASDSPRQNGIRLQSSFGQHTRRVIASPEQSSYSQAIEEREAPLYQTGLQLSYQRRIADWLCLEGGLAYLQIISRYRYEKETKISGSFPSDSASYFNYPDESTIYLPGQLDQTIIIERQVQQYNYHHSLGFTLGAQLQHRLGSIPLFLRGQYAYYPWRWVEGRSLTPSLQLRDYRDTALRQTLSEQLSMLQLHLGSCVPLTNKLTLEGGLLYRRTLSNTRAIRGVEVQYSAWGGFIGIGWAW